MEEAVEICKLRLFLKLVAQLDSYDQIEPLPDVDFNVRAGNTLVGFAMFKEIRDAFVSTLDGQQRMLYPEDEAKLKRIEEDAEFTDRAFRKFREMQIRYGMNAGDFTNAKLDLRNRLDGLRMELDRYLASQYGIETNDQKLYEQWRATHQPFHWFVEFYGIMHNGGFDVLIGNPPYVELSAVSQQYRPQNFATEKCGNLYALCTERSFTLQHYNARFGFIVQQPITSTIRMTACRDFISRNSAFIWSSTYDDRPSKLFSGMHHARLAIILSKRDDRTSLSPILYVTRYNKWFQTERDYVFERPGICYGFQRQVTGYISQKFQAPQKIK